MSDSPPRLNLIQRAMQHAQGRTAEVASSVGNEQAQSVPHLAMPASKVADAVIANEPAEKIKRSATLPDVSLHFLQKAKLLLRSIWRSPLLQRRT